MGNRGSTISPMGCGGRGGPGPLEASPGPGPTACRSPRSTGKGVRREKRRFNSAGLGEPKLWVSPGLPQPHLQVEGRWGLIGPHSWHHGDPQPPTLPSPPGSGHPWLRTPHSRAAPSCDSSCPAPLRDTPRGAETYGVRSSPARGARRQPRRLARVLSPGNFPRLGRTPVSRSAKPHPEPSPASRRGGASTRVPCPTASPAPRL